MDMNGNIKRSVSTKCKLGMNIQLKCQQTCLSLWYSQVNTKVLCKPVLYGRGIPSIAEQLGKTVQEAQKIYDKVLSKFEGLANFISESEDMAREFGFVTTVWGRRRQLPDMQLPYFEFKYKDGVSPDFDPLMSDASEYSDEVPIDVVEDLTKKLLSCRGYKQKEELKERIRSKGISVKDNGSFIAQAQRQCVNARVQGEPKRLNCPFAVNRIAHGCVA